MRLHLYSSNEDIVLTGLSHASDVTQENSPVTICVYDRSSEEETFLGLVDIQPKQQHGWSVDDWYT